MNAPPIDKNARGNGQVTTGRENQEREEFTSNLGLTQDRNFTTGRGVFYHPETGSNRPEDIRFQLEMKLAACVAIGGTNGYPIQPHRIKNPCFRSLVAYGMIFRNWSLKDLTECADRLEGAASMVLVATLENPVWGASDYHLFDALEKFERLQNSAWRSGRTL